MCCKYNKHPYLCPIKSHTSKAHDMDGLLKSFRIIQLLDGISLVSEATKAPFFNTTSNATHLCGLVSVYQNGIRIATEKEVCIPVEKVLYYEK